MKLALITLITLALAGCSTTPMTPAEQAEYDRGVEQLYQRLAAGNAQGQQTFNMLMGMVNQTQVGNLTTSSYTPVQTNTGTWVYCRRLSDYTVTCRTQ